MSRRGNEARSCRPSSQATVMIRRKNDSGYNYENEAELGLDFGVTVPR